jgi:(4S)-4-hydroxy-5-phosphonooxypentane-2,3-dione isomerase
MSTITLLGTVKVVPGAREELLALLDAHRTRSLEEPGTLQFEVLVPRVQENVLYMYEVYADEHAFAAHVKGASFARITEETAGLITELMANSVTAIDMASVATGPWFTPARIAS